MSAAQRDDFPGGSMKIQGRTGAIRRLLTVAMPMTVFASLVTTGAILPVASPRPPAVEARAHRLAQGTVGPGFDQAVETGLPTQMVGFVWTGLAGGSVDVRVQEGNGAQNWLHVEGDPYEGPDTNSKENRQRTSAGPVWIGADVRKVEVRVTSGQLSDLTLHAIRSENPPSAAGIKPAEGMPAQPGIISRASWGADESFRSISPGCNGQPSYASNVRFALVHHTDGSNSYGPGDSAAIVRGIYYFHTHTNQWCDIGYNFLVDRF